MSKGARIKRAVVFTVSAAFAATMLTGCSQGGGDSAAGGDVTLEFAQWWEPELSDGALRGLMDDFEAANPGITVDLLSGPYASTKEQLFAGAAAGTMSDVVGLDGAWISDFAKQGALADLGPLLSDAGFDESQLSSTVVVDGKTAMVPVVNFVYPLFTNDALLSEAGVSAPPSTRSEFESAAKAITALGDNTSGWVLPLSSDAPNGIQNDVMSWVWASGGSMLDDGKPDLTNDAVTSAVDYIAQLDADGVIAPGAATMKEQDKVEEFTNGRVGMMIDSLSHIATIRESNPDLKFSISAIPAEDGFSGERGIPFASWGIGVSASSEHPAEAAKLVSFLMSADTNSTLSTLANAFPGNTASTPDFSDSDPLYQEAFDIYSAGYPANEFVGLPVAEQLMRDFDEQLQAALNGDQSVDEALEKSQEAWLGEF
ncbi:MULTISPECIES: sugar ABC transporter substrate-binding protein [Rathayibacter]|uniref:Extracellular solute-binding protein n=1 Tax=Rathayibacter festucae TaxID=110937 RepID=A0ABX6H173_9MICO|nr:MULTISPECIES: sugar ABC transporter substrate-binding protein [Rathayibacter]MCJ1672785.1 sugar ABC transporter substrate-binding protein [Rathayibacter sp. VKM Ac-2929]MCJ1682264.1 sugar ABC transporter substrate-binding protein [Rathayibacter sp. VKM Ac-2928]MCJ1699522.1 sugar ABC transporter substrate-binding protein [Rathayibacter festucae]QHC63531.1 extracellular solute-binding protein [Rathayibacter festucae]ROP57598.1 multiple sugar transport system substrate-binding protein [Rathayi